MFDRRFALLAEREAAALAARVRSAFGISTAGRRYPFTRSMTNGRIEHVSDAWLDLLGYAREEVKGRPLTDFMTEASAARRTTGRLAADCSGDRRA